MLWPGWSEGEPGMVTHFVEVNGVSTRGARSAPYAEVDMNNQILNHLLMKSKYLIAIILTSFLISGCYKSSLQQTNTPISTETTINPSTTSPDRFASATINPPLRKRSNLL